MLKSVIPLFICLALFANHSRADDPLTINPFSPFYGQDFESGWHFDVGAGIGYEPTYAGSDKSIVEADLLARAMYRTDSGHRFFINFGEAGAIFSLTPRTQFSAFLEYEDERDDEDDSTLTGMDTIDSTIEGQFMLAHRFGNATIFGILQPDITGDANKGLVWFLGGSYDYLSNNKKWRTSTSINISGGDSEYMRTEFGVTSNESARTRYAVYTPDSGFKSMTLGFGSEYFFSERLSLLGNVEGEYYFSEASDSPLIDIHGTDFTVEANMLVRWRF